MCDYRSVEIERGVGGSFGFSIIGGIDTELPPMVCALVHNGSAQLSGKIQVGDVLVEVNGECVSRLPAKKVVETVKFSPDVLQLRLRKDPEAVARARPFLRRHSVQDPKLQQFQRKVLRRSASLPSRPRRPTPRTISERGQRREDSLSDMSRGRMRIVGEDTSPTGIDKGTDGTFRKRVSSRTGSFSKIMTSFPAHGGPPRTVENPRRITVRVKVRGEDDNLVTKAIPEASWTSLRRNASLHSSSLPEIPTTHDKGDNSPVIWQRLSSSQSDIQKKRTSRNISSNNNESLLGENPGTPLAHGDQSPNLTVSMNASPYPFRKARTSPGTPPSPQSDKELIRRETPVVREKQSPDQSSQQASSALAKRLFLFDGYQSKDVAPLLGKNNNFSKEVAIHFMKFFDFTNETVVESLRKMLNKFNLTGETQERERILIAFSNRYYECNKPEYGTADAVHTLVCAIMLLNTDLHGEQTLGKRMKQADFMKNLSQLCDGQDFPADLLKDIYSSIKTQPLQLYRENNEEELNKTKDSVKTNGQVSQSSSVSESFGSLALMGYQTTDDDVIYKEGLLYRKTVEEAGGKKISAWKRGWQPFFATLRGMIMFLHKPEESRNFDDTRFSVGVHHSFASPALDYTKKPAVFRFITADWSVMLFRARDKTDMHDWVEGLNLVAASFSSPPLPAPVGSCKKFQRPVLPFSRTRLTLTEQLASHEKKAQEMADVLIDHLRNQPQSTDTRLREVDEWMEKRDFYDYEYKRYRSYVNILKSSKLQSQLRERESRKALAKEYGRRNGLFSDTMKRCSSLNDLLNVTDGEDDCFNANHRESYFMAIYRE